LRRSETPDAAIVCSARAFAVNPSRLRRDPEDPDGFYRKALTSCWATAFKKLKPGSILAFTFHHDQDGPWIDVLESLFEAGFILVATFPVRGDETKGEGQYGSQKVEYDVIHVCRKRLESPTRVSWAKMRREVLQDVRQLQELLEHHAKEGLPAGDLQANNPQQSWGFDGEPPEAVIKESGTRMGLQEDASFNCIPSP
jgi:adenine-specific DNA methylase